MGMICALFGHTPPSGCWRGEPGYFKVHGICIDGVGTHHASLFGDCERCGENYEIGRIHIPHEYSHPNRKKAPTKQETKCLHKFEVSSPIDTAETCVKCGETRDCEPIYK